MFRRRYTRWDGTQKIQLSLSQVFDKLSEHLFVTGDFEQAMDCLVRQGIESSSLRVTGLDDILDTVRATVRRHYRQFNLDASLDEVREQLNEILALEKSTLQELGDSVDNCQKKELIDSLPHHVGESMQQLCSYSFESRDAGSESRRLLEEFGNVQDLEEFQHKYGDLFHGQESLDYGQAVELMRKITALKELEEELFSGNLQALKPEEVDELLGGEEAEAVKTLQQMMEMVSDSAYVKGDDGRSRLSAKGVRKIGELALRDIYQSLLRDRAGSHAADHRGLTEVRPYQTRPYQFGDPLNLNLVQTLRNTLLRKPGVPLLIAPGDFEIFEADSTTTTSTVLLLDMSWSMSWEGRFPAAKKVALALETLLRTRFPRDYFGIVGFFTRAVELHLKDLPEASWSKEDPFTNLQAGLRLASDLLSKHPNRNQHMIVITDGQPTAFFSKGQLYCEWPISFGGVSKNAAAETLKEVERVTRKGITINTFMLDDSPTLRTFVDRMTRINKGKALYTRPDHLGEYLLVDHFSHRRKKV